MSTRARRAGLIAAPIVLAAVLLGVFAWESIYWLVMTDRFVTVGLVDKEHPVRGYVRVSRWGDSDRWLKTDFWYEETGTRSSSKVYEESDRPKRVTEWNLDGSVEKQYWTAPEGTRNSPPWRWGVRDESASSSPWWHPVRVTKVGAGEVVAHYVENGFLAYHKSVRPHEVRYTGWNIDGTLRVQWHRATRRTEVREEAPWWWGVAEQTEPTAPWWEGR